jgi:hypothetical protein
MSIAFAMTAVGQSRRPNTSSLANEQPFVVFDGVSHQ